MFEETLLSAHSTRGSGVRRWTLAASVMAQALGVAGLIFLPLLYPATLPRFDGAPRMVPLVQYHPLPKPRPVPAKPAPTPNALARALHTPPPQQAAERPAAPQSGIIAKAPSTSTDEAPLLALGGGMSTSLTLSTGTGIGQTSSGLAAVAATQPAKTAAGPLRISTGVSEGMLLAPIRPQYPRIAIAAHQQGTVIVTAVIDRTGHITQLQVVSGPAMLRTAALDAIQTARYRPFLLNGQTTDVVTTISVTFHLAA